ncbi:penicillin acylase family protein [Kitasatospora kazusensis]|uniref:Penicillin acylase family protein n=1 Tax=Kitasatospora kazusensis TaxID=407974 RepID=A0ABN2ZV51_9ACTN
MREPGELTKRYHRFPLKRLAASAAALCIAAAPGLLPTPASASAPSTASAVTTTSGNGHTAEIRRTEYGIPHILAHDFGGLGYGYGYAFAQDNLCATADRVVTLRGERSRYFGPTAASSDILESPATNLASDTYYQAQREAGTVQQLLDRPAPLGPTDRMRQLVDGYADGYNRYLRDTGVANLPDPTCKGKPWVGPITALDIWTLIHDVDQVAGAPQYKQLIATATPPTAGTGAGAGAGAGGKAAAAPPAPLSLPGAPGASGVPGAPDAPVSRTGSNGWALGRDATQGHDGMLLANPHLPWTGNARFYQVQLTIPGVLDVSGASIYGTPLVEIGHTRGLAWTHTTTYAQHAELYRLSLVPGDPTSYLVDGKAVPMTRQTVQVSAPGADGKPATVTSTLYTSRYGPVLASNWTAANAYAIRDANADNLRSMNEWLAMDTSQNVAQLKAAQSAYQGIPWTYTLATDTGGTAYFTDSSVVPHLTDAQARQCAVPGGALDGSTTACDWGSDPDAIEPGIFGPGSAPRLTRTDYLANSNNSPYLANPAEPLTGYPGVYASGRQLDLRPQLGLRMIAQRLDGTDGLGTPGFTLPTLQDTMLGDRDLSGELGRDDVLTMCRAHSTLTATDGTPVDTRAACDALAGWNLRGDADSHGAVLWSAFFGLLNDWRIPQTWWRVPYDPAQPLTTPRGINGDDPQVQRALADAVQQLGSRGLAPDAAPASTQRWAGVPLNGCDGGEGCFNVLNATVGSGGAGAVDPGQAGGAFGSSFVMAVELTPHGPDARTLLTYGESVNPTSPHYSDQAVLFSQKQWVTERFTEAEIKADPQLHTTRLCR